MDARLSLWAIGLIICLALVGMLARRHVLLYRVVGDSMEPALFDDDIVVARRLPRTDWRIRTEIGVKKGDVVALSVLSFEKGVLIKRVVGTSGDRLEMRTGELLVNDQPFPIQKISESPDNGESRKSPGPWHYSFLSSEVVLNRYHPTGLNWGPIIVPSDAAFVMGDHRWASGDSRAFGFVFAPELVARVHLALSRKNGIRLL